MALLPPMRGFPIEPQRSRCIADVVRESGLGAKVASKPFGALPVPSRPLGFVGGRVPCKKQVEPVDRKEEVEAQDECDGARPERERQPKTPPLAVDRPQRAIERQDSGRKQDPLDGMRAARVTARCREPSVRDGAEQGGGGKKAARGPLPQPLTSSRRNCHKKEYGRQEQKKRQQRFRRCFL